MTTKHLEIIDELIDLFHEEYKSKPETFNDNLPVHIDTPLDKLIIGYTRNNIVQHINSYIPTSIINLYKKIYCTIQKPHTGGLADIKGLNQNQLYLITNLQILNNLHNLMIIPDFDDEDLTDYLKPIYFDCNHKSVSVEFTNHKFTIDKFAQLLAEYNDFDQYDDPLSLHQGPFRAYLFEYDILLKNKYVMDYVKQNGISKLRKGIKIPLLGPKWWVSSDWYLNDEEKKESEIICSKLRDIEKEVQEWNDNKGKEGIEKYIEPFFSKHLWDSHVILIPTLNRDTRLLNRDRRLFIVGITNDGNIAGYTSHIAALYTDIEWRGLFSDLK
eukprot:345767_1